MFFFVLKNIILLKQSMKTIANLPLFQNYISLRRSKDSMLRGYGAIFRVLFQNGNGTLIYHVVITLPPSLSPKFTNRKKNHFTQEK